MNSHNLNELSIKSVSVIIAAKNEESNIEPLLNALRSQEFEGKIEMIIVDDESSDKTSSAAYELSKNMSFVKIVKAGQKELPGKKGALTIGIKHSSHPYIMITDADCIPQPGWIQAFAERFISGYDFLFGISPFKQTDGWINKLACFENLRSSFLTFTLASLGLPYCAVARSFGFRRDAFNKIGGYKNTNETLSGDDDLMIREAVKHKLRIGTVISDNSKVFSRTKSTVKEYIFQKARHTSTSHYYLLRHKAVLGIWHFLNLSFLFSPILIPLSNTFVLPFLFKITTDIIIVKTFQRKIGYNFKLLEIIPLQIFYELMLILNYFLSFFRKNKW